MTTLHSSSEVPAAADVATTRAAARRWLADRELTAEERHAVLIVLSELVTNAVRHAQTAFTASLDEIEDGIRVEVFDLDTRQPIFVGADDEATSGRGMQIVAALASDWGSNSEERDGIHGKVVWADLTRSAD